MALPVHRLKRMNLPADLKAALLESGAITSNVAARRHRQYIGVLMRNVAPEEIQEAMALSADNMTVESGADTEVLKWAGRLTENGPDAVSEFIQAHPGIDRQRLRQLIRNAAREKQGGTSGKSANALKRMIKDILG